MAISLASLLDDYSPPADRTPPGIALIRRVKAETKVERAPDAEPTQVDLQAELLKQAVATAREEERRQAQARLAEAVAAERSRFEDELKSQRVMWVEQEGSQLSIQIAETIGNVERILSAQIANILKPFLSGMLRQQVIDEFENALNTLLSSPSSKFMRVTGPQDILSAIEGRLGDRGKAIEFVPSDDVEVRAVAQDTVIETQLNAWMSGLARISRAD